MNRQSSAPAWMSRWLVAAGIYNLVWGAVVIAFPNLLFDLVGMDRPVYPQIWQCVGMIVGVYGIGYLAAARDPLRHWPIVLVGFLGKIFGPIGFAAAVVKGELPVAFGATILTNDLVWWAPFGMMLWAAAKSAHEPPAGTPGMDEAMALPDQRGVSLGEITAGRRTLVVFLRHSGCTFCKETLADLARQREAIERAGLAIAVVTMSSAEKNGEMARASGLESASWVSDPERVAYRAFELGRGRFGQLFGPRVWWRGFVATLGGHLVGRLDGDGFQMPGAFVVEDGRVVRAYRHRDAAERADYGAFACGVAA